MKKEIVLLLLFTVSLSLLAQEKGRTEESDFVYLDYDSKDSIAVYDSPNGKVKTYLKNNFEEEDFIMFRLKRKNKGMFYAAAYNSIDEQKIIEGWIYPSLLRIDLRQNSPIFLYTQPNKRAKLCDLIREYDPHLYTILDFHGKWLKVKRKLRSKMFVGWVAHDQQKNSVY